MRRYLLDSNALKAFINRHGHTGIYVAAAARRGDQIGTCEPVVAEMYRVAALNSVLLEI